MAAIIIETHVTRTELTCPDNSASRLDLSWNVVQSAGPHYMGPFYLHWYVDGVHTLVKTLDAQPQEGDCYLAFLENVALPEAGAVTVCVSPTELDGGVGGSEAVPVIWERLHLLRAATSRDYLELVWEVPNREGLFGRVTITDEGGLARWEQDSPPGSRRTLLPRSAMGFLPGASLSMTVRGWMEDRKKGWLALGPTTQRSAICTTVLSLRSVDVADGQVTVEYDMPQDAARDLEVLFALLRGGEERYRTESFPPTQEGEGYRQSFPLPQGFPVCPDAYELALFCRNGACVSEEMNGSNLVSLAAPVAEGALNADGQAVLRWSCAGPWDRFLVKLGDLPPQETGAQELCMELEEVAGKAAAVAALYGTSRLRGPYCASQTFLREGFFADAGQPGLLRFQGQRTGSFSVALPSGLFEAPLSEPISAGPYTIREADGATTLTIQCEGEFSLPVLTELVELLFVRGVTPMGYYRLRDAVTRLSPLPGRLVLPYYCGAKQNGFSAELLPGLILRTETAYYIQQTAPNAPDNNGFVRGAVGEYFIGLTHGDGESVLELDSFFQHVVGSWADAVEVHYPRPTAGLADFFYAPLRSAYYRLCYPGAFHDSAYPGTPYATDNICLMALRPDEETPGRMQDTDIPGLLLRGRTSATLHLPIFVAGAPVTVPVGTTLAGALARFGAGGERVRLFRQMGALGRLLPVYLGKQVDSEGFQNALVLLAGDRIEV